MFTNSVLAVTGALLSVVAAVPMAEQHHHHHRRDYVWITHTQEEVVTVPVTKTVWIEPGETPPTEQPQGYSAPSSADVEPAATSVASAPAYTPPSSPMESSSSIAPAYTPPTSSSTSVYVAPTTSSTSVYVAPTTSSTSVYVAPTPTTPTSTYVPPPATTYAAPTTSSAAAYSAPAASSDSGSSGSSSGLSSGMAKAGTSYSGDLTWYQVGLGACGENSVSSDPIVAVSEAIFDSYNNGNPNNNPLCGKYVSITGADGSQFKGKIVDRCPGCAEADLDLSEDFFNSVTNNGDGRVHNMKWEFM